MPEDTANEDDTENSSGYQLTDIDGVGADSAGALQELGYETARDIAFASPSDVADADGFGESRAETVIDAAGDLVFDSSDDDGSTNDSNDEAEETVETFVVELLNDDDLNLHVLHVLLDEATLGHRQNADEHRDTAYDVAWKLLEALLSDEPTEIELTEQELNVLNQAVRNGIDNYMDMTGIGGLWSDLGDVADEVSDIRSEIFD